MEAVRGQKHPSEAKNIMKELIYRKKYSMKVSQQPQKPLGGSNQIWATTSGKNVRIFEATEVTLCT
jgi:methylglyoxal synthase